MSGFTVDAAGRVDSNPDVTELKIIERKRAEQDAIEQKLEDREYGDSYDEARAEGLAVRK